MKDQTFTENDIHYFTCSEGRKWAHLPWAMITGEIPDGVVYPDATDSNGWPDGSQFGRATDKRQWAYPNMGSSANANPQGWFAIIPADRIEVVTEYVEASVMDAIDALKESGGKPVEGWVYCDEPHGVQTFSDLVGVYFGAPFPFNTTTTWFAYAYRPVTRVRIKAEVKESLTPEALATAEESSGVGELEKAFDKYWNNGSRHRAIDAFRAGVKWAKGVQGE